MIYEFVIYALYSIVHINHKSQIINHKLPLATFCMIPRNSSFVIRISGSL